jgi:branched-chain amino acid transport system permease protein
MAVGAYTTAVLTNNFEVPFLVAFLCSGLTAGIIGLLFGMPSMRVKGFYLDITTIAAQFIIIWIINHWTDVTQGFTGVSVPPATIGNFVFDSEVKQFYLILPLTALCVFFATNLGRSRIGRAFIAIRDNDLAAEVMGINVFNYKLLAFFLGCFFAGIAGSLFAQSNFINAENFTFTDSILYIGMIIIGGLGTAVGPIFGAVFIRLLQQFVIMLSPMIEGIFTWLPSGFATGIGPMVFGLVIVLFLVIEPRGLAHRWNLFKASYRLWPFSY